MKNDELYITIEKRLEQLLDLMGYFGKKDSLVEELEDEIEDCQLDGLPIAYKIDKLLEITKKLVIIISEILESYEKDIDENPKEEKEEEEEDNNQEDEDNLNDLDEVLYEEGEPTPNDQKEQIEIKEEPKPQKIYNEHEVKYFLSKIENLQTKREKVYAFLDRFGEMKTDIMVNTLNIARNSIDAYKSDYRKEKSQTK